MDRVREWVNVPALLAAIVSGSTYAIIKVGLQEFTPLSYAGGRLILGAFLLFAFVAVTEKSPQIARKDLPLLGVAGLIGIGAFQILYVESLKYTTASNSALLIATSPIFAALTAAATRQESLPARRVAGILLGFVGVALVVQAGGFRLGREGLLGDFLALGAAISFAWYGIAGAPLLKRYSAMKVTAYILVAGALAVGPVAAGDLLSLNWAALSLTAWSTFVYGAVVGLVLGFILWCQGIKQSSPTRTLVYVYLTPVCAVIFAVILLGETLTPIQLVGAAVAFAGVGLARR